jgi:hypothetical protein
MLPEEKIFGLERSARTNPYYNVAKGIPDELKKHGKELHKGWTYSHGVAGCHVHVEGRKSLILSDISGKKCSSYGIFAEHR